MAMLKRFLLAAVAVSYLALIGVQAAHYHKDGRDAKPEACAICATADQAARQAPHNSPAVSENFGRGAVVLIVSTAPADAVPAEASARAPPPAA